MIILNFDLTTGLAKLAQPATIKLGADVPVTIVFSAAPGTVSSMKLALGSDASTPAVLAYTDTFTEQNATTWTALLDANDTRLATFMTDKGTAPVNAELVVVIDGVRQVTPNLSITVQAKIISGPTSSDGGPTYYTEAEANAAIAAAVSAVIIRASGMLTGYTDAGSASTETGAAVTVTFLATGGTTATGTITITINSVPHIFSFNTGDPANGSTWIDCTSFASETDYAAAFATALGALAVAVSGSSPAVIITTTAVGVGATLTATAASVAGGIADYTSITGSPATGGGSPAVSPSGNVDEVTLISGVDGKSIRLIQAGLTGCLPYQAQLFLKSPDGETYIACTGVISPGGYWQSFLPDDNGGGSTPSAWLAGIAGYSLVAHVLDDPSVQSGAATRIEVLATQS